MSTLSRRSAEVQTKHQKGDLSYFQRSIDVGTRQAGLSISETAHLGFSCTTITTDGRKEDRLVFLISQTNPSLIPKTWYECLTPGPTRTDLLPQVGV